MTLTLNDIAQNGLFCDGDWIEKKDQNPDGEVRLIQLADIGECVFKDKSNRHITVEKAQELHCTYLEKGDILIARLPDPLGRACIFPYSGKYITAVDVAVVRPNNPDIDSRYLMYLINSAPFRRQIKDYESGTTRKRISRKNLARITFEIPALQEQYRVVDRIEELFSQLDAGIETLEKSKAQLAIYEQAIYASVFSSVSDMRPITEFFDISGGLTKNSNRSKYQLKMPYLRVANVYYDRLELDEIKTIGVSEAEAADKLLKKNDLLFVEGNGSKSQIGRVAVWDGSIPNCLHQNHLIKARPNGKMLPRYALYYLICKFGREQIIKVASSTSGLYTLSTGKIANLKLPYCPISQQEKCLDEISARLSVSESIVHTIDEALEQAEAMRQSILKEAFEGRL